MNNRFSPIFVIVRFYIDYYIVAGYNRFRNFEKSWKLFKFRNRGELAFDSLVNFDFQFSDIIDPLPIL